MRRIIIFFSVFFLCACDDNSPSPSVDDLLMLQQRFERALSPLKSIHFSINSIDKFDQMQSPFEPRKISKEKKSFLPNLLSLHWRLAGKIYHHQILLGIFLKSKNKSIYLGTGLPIANSDWRIQSITNDSVIIENSQHQRRILNYDLV